MSKIYKTLEHRLLENKRVLMDEKKRKSALDEREGKDKLARTTRRDGCHDDVGDKKGIPFFGGKRFFGSYGRGGLCCFGNSFFAVARGGQWTREGKARRDGCHDGGVKRYTFFWRKTFF